MIEALIRDDKRLICVVTIQDTPQVIDSPDKAGLNVDIFTPSKGQTLSGVMPAGGEPAQQVARAIMTVYPVSALRPDLRPASQIVQEHGDCRDQEEETIKAIKVIERRSGEGATGSPQPLSRNMQESKMVSSEEEVWAEIDRKIDEISKRERDLCERKKSVIAEMEDLRKFHPDYNRANPP